MSIFTTSSGADAFGFGVEVGEDAVAEGGVGDFADVVGADVVAAVEEGAGFAREDESLAGAGAGAPAYVVFDEFWGVGLVEAGLADEADGVLDDVVGDWDFADEALEREDIFGGEDVLEIDFSGGGGEADDVEFFLLAGVGDEDVEHEAIELGFGERVCAFLFDGVLGGHDEERFGEAVLNAAGGDLVLLHGFEEGGLGFGRGAVDFIGEEGVGEDGAADEAQRAFTGGFFFLDNFGAGDVGRHEVGGELDAVEGHGEGFGEGGDEQRFGEAGDADEEAMAAAEQCDEELFHDFGLADDDLAEFAFQSGIGFLEFFDAGHFIGGHLGDLIGGSKGGGRDGVRHGDSFGVAKRPSGGQLNVAA